MYMYIRYSREVPESGLIGHERDGSPVLLPMGRLRQVNLLKLQRILWLCEDMMVIQESLHVRHTYCTLLPTLTIRIQLLSKFLTDQDGKG